MIAGGEIIGQIEQRHDAPVGTRFILAGQATVPGDICIEYGGQLVLVAILCHGVSITGESRFAYPMVSIAQSFSITA